MLKVKIITGEDNYIISAFITSQGNYDLDELLKDGFDFNYATCFKMVEGKPVLDEQKKEAEQEQRIHDARVNELIGKLEESDIEVTAILDDLTSLNNPVTFVSDLISILASFNSKYAQLVKDRKAWRTELNELKK